MTAYNEDSIGLSDGQDTHSSPQSAPLKQVRSDIINNMSSGEHHLCQDLPEYTGPLPSREKLSTAFSQLETRMFETGAVFLADAHLSGHAAVTKRTDTGVLYGVVDTDLFIQYVIDTLTTSAVETDPVPWENEVISEVATAVSLGFKLELAQRISSPDPVQLNSPNWPSITGKQTTDTTPIIFTTPHNVKALEEAELVPHRGLAAVAGIQRLTTELSTTAFPQQDIGAIYILAVAQKTASHTQVCDFINRMYNLSPEHLPRLQRDFSRAVSPSNIPPTEQSNKYYLTENEIINLQEIALVSDGPQKIKTGAPRINRVDEADK